MTTREQRIVALKSANTRRAELARLRSEIHASRERAVDVLLDPPPEAYDLAVIEVLVLARSSLGWRSKALTTIGNRALIDRVNLMVPLGRASRRTREWAATEGMRWTRDSRPSKAAA